LGKQQMLPDIDHMDIGARQETLAVRGEPIMLQLCVIPAYALTIHKTQALSIKHLVVGCLEGVFAMGQVYVLISRVTDPRNFLLCGLPPKDLWEDVSQAWLRAGLNIDDCWKRACSVTNEWTYDPGAGPLKTRIRQRIMTERCIPLKNRPLSEVLNPQPEASVVIQRVLDWIDRVDRASQTGEPKPDFETEEGDPIFPEDDDPWWLTDVSRRVAQEEKVDGDEDGLASEELEPEQREVSDSDAGSEPEGATSTRRHAPFVAWRRS